MLAYGTNIVGGVTPGKGGRTTEHGLPVFDTVKDAVEATGATHTCIFVPPPFAADALFEALRRRHQLRGLHHRGRAGARHAARSSATTPGMRIIGPNCPGLVSPGKAWSASCPGTSSRRATSA